ncbi:MAG: type IV toxin-antitoxin system AbiEi family antitoxin domain-containing protein [Candidatus Micrarchaeota archaeon]|nr:type IV toxin-antitoxin system AbiEi family antitoxin domain-containing protein [Candidatus Micrarchaeota archaeon]
MRYMEELVGTFSKDEHPIFTSKDAALALKGRGISSDYLNLMLHNLAKTGRITRITKGAYTFHDDAAVVGFAFQPFYYGLESALWLRGISGQGANFIVMTPRNVRAGIRDFKGRNYRVQKIHVGMMFGYGLVRYGRFWLPVSDLEKTVIDMACLGYHINDELLPVIRKRIDRKKLEGYTKRFGPELTGHVNRVLGR